jgi:hypothetical protein
MSYGWMLLVVAIMGGAIFSLVGSQGIESVTGFEGEQVMVSDFGLSGESIMFSVMNSNTERIKIQGIEMRSSNGNTTMVGGPEISASGQETFTLDNVKKSDGTTESELRIFYSKGDLENLVASGSLTGNIKIEESGEYSWNSTCKHKEDAYIDIDLDGSGSADSKNVYCDDAIAYYPFINGSTGDLSGNKYSANPVREDVMSGVSDEALNFTGGKDSIQTELVLEDRLISKMRSFCFYIKPSLIKDSLPSDDGRTWDDHNFFHDNGRNNPYDEYGWHLFNSSTVSVGYGGEGLTKSVMEYHGMVEDEWTHLCHTIGNSKMNLYVNGSRVDQTNTHQGALDYQVKGPSPLFGRHIPGKGVADGLYGGLDEVRFYDYKISREKIKKLSNVRGGK